MNSEKVLKKQAEARFKKTERALDRQTAMTEYETKVLAIREKTAHLRALRLAICAGFCELTPVITMTSERTGH